MIKPQNVVILGCGTNVGKTIVSAIFTKGWNGIYWKPIHCGSDESDVGTVKRLVPNSESLPEVYSFREHGSAHYVSKLEGIIIDEKKLHFPKNTKPLVVESSGGIMHPLRKDLIQIDLISKWKVPTILVSHHYLGSINHTLLTIEAMKKRNIEILGVVFNGEPYPDAEEVILDHAKAPAIGHLLPEKTLDAHVISSYAKHWNL